MSFFFFMKVATYRAPTLSWVVGILQNKESKKRRKKALPFELWNVRGFSGKYNKRELLLIFCVGFRLWGRSCYCVCSEGSSGTPLSSLPSSGSTAAKPSGSRVSKNLFSVPASEAADPSTGAAALSALGAGGGRGSSGFSFAAPSSGSSHLATHLSGKPLFGSATSADHGGWIEICWWAFF